MAPNEPPQVQPGKCYTLSEAVELMRERDKHPTIRSIGWVSCRTGKPVSIGYNN